MQTKETIEDIVTRELKGLCSSCVHVDTCVYHKATTKIIIQCELFELDQKECDTTHALQGLCLRCDHAFNCTLPGRKEGVWRCNEFI